jgi:hypothetical protein
MFQAKIQQNLINLGGDVVWLNSYLEFVTSHRLPNNKMVSN